METTTVITISAGVVNSKMTDTTNKTEENGGLSGYTQTRVGDHTVITPKDKKASVYQKVTPREQYAVARDVANRAINEINAVRSRRPSSFTGGINDANIAARMQAAETYGDTLPGGKEYSRSRQTAYDIADSYRNVLATAPKPPIRTEPIPVKPDEPKPEPPRESHDAWINQQYRELLGREAETEGLNYWTGDLNRGQTKDQVRSNIMLSDEFKNRLKLVTDYKNEHGVNPAEDWLDARVGPGGQWLMEGYGDDVDVDVNVDVDVSDPETFLQAFGKVGRNSGPTGGRGLGNKGGNKGGNKSSSGPSSNSNRGTGGQGRQGRTSTRNNPSSNKGNRGGSGKGGASTGRRGGQGNKGRGR